MIKTAHIIAPAREACRAIDAVVPSLNMTGASAHGLDLAAAEYTALPLFDRSATRAWDALAVEVNQQWQALEDLGFTLIVQGDDPYPTAADMFADVERRVIRVLATATTGGHPYWSDNTNDLFRAVHDVMGHAATGRGFDRHGEVRAYEHHARTFSDLARQALATELRGQAAYLAVNGEFPVQKIAVSQRLVDFNLRAFTLADQYDGLTRHAAGGLRTTTV